MTTKKEDVLLQVPEVRYKKTDGTLYVLNERIAFMSNNRLVFSNHFKDIKMQKISPEGKPKIQLQVVLHDGNSSTFHFVSKNAIPDRDKVKELVHQLMPNFRRKVDKELEEKNKLLSENPQLLQLYKDLVPTQVVTSEEFWKLYSKELNKRNIKKQEIGVSGSFLADIKPVADGCNGFKYNLTPDIIESIFKTYPAVKKKYQETVPEKMEESEFWGKFFQSHYFHKDRPTTGFKDIFTECGKMDDIALKIAIRNNLGDPLLDLTKFGDNTIEEDFCSSSAYNDQKPVESSTNMVYQSIIKRFNHHSFMVLKTSVEKGNAEYDKIFQNVGSTTETGKKHRLKDINIDEICAEKELTEEEQEKMRECKRRKITEKTFYDDLTGDSKETGQQEKGSVKLAKVERYLFGPMPSSAGGDFNERFHEHDLDSVNQMIKMNVEQSWNLRTPHKNLVSATNAVNALGELSPGGALMRTFHDHNLSQFVPPDVEKDIRNLYIASRELLKQFWSSFPPTTPELEKKATRMHECLQRFSMSKVKPLEDRAIRELSPLGTQLLKHLNLLITKAYRKWQGWQERQQKSRHR